jgi:hypothetical protein
MNHYISEQKIKLARSSTDPEILDSLLDHNPAYMKYEILKNPNTSLKTLNKILDSDHYFLYYIQYYLQRHPNADEKFIIKCRAKDLSFLLSK